MPGSIDPVISYYALPGWAENPQGICMPDAVVKALLGAMLNVSKPVFEKHLDLMRKGLVPDINRHRILIDAPRMPWDESCKLVQMAVEANLPDIAERAKAALNNQARWKRVEVETGDCWGRTHQEDMKAPAWVEFGADGTISDAVYIAHELGHLIAADYCSEKQLPAPEFYPRKHMVELQSFMVQHALYDYAMQPERLPLLRNAATQHYIAEVARSIYHCALSLIALEAHNMDEIGKTEAAVKTLCAQSMLKALGPRWDSFHNAQWLAKNGANQMVHIQNMAWSIHSHSGAAIIGAGLYSRYRAAKPEQRQKIMYALYSTCGRNTVMDVLEAAGVATQEALEQFMSESLWATADPLQQLHARGRMGARA
jgi:oligoendopeptidase F